ncbi:uncharacterized protein LOC135958451 [Calliphora vicina]|uniref:uncharacterized protein LOC135958451 n=1 Tax=Calliphora vicina TaxID=7373 RepID=UPI00325B9B63
MSLVHSNENLTSLVEHINKRKCTICDKDYEIDDIVVSAPCDHIFHKNCIAKVLNETQACPVCSKPCRQTKLKSYNILKECETQATSNPDSFNANVSNKGAIPKTNRKNIRRNVLESETTRMSTFNRNNDEEISDNILNLSPTNSQNVLLNFDPHNMSDNTLQDLINEAVRNQLESLNINSNHGNRPNTGNFNNNNRNQSFRSNRNNFGRANQHGNSRESLGNTNFNNNNSLRRLSGKQSYGNTNMNQSYDLTTDKVSSIISGWHLKFSGQEEDGLSVDNFIYRVQALTNQGLRGDFDLLCADFVRAFGLAKDLFSENISHTIDVNLSEMETDENVHILDSVQREKLDIAINSFPSFSKEGLGRTTLVSHTIDTAENKPIKQRYFAVSPAIEQLLFAEIDRMLQLGVIEESQSPWSSPVALVRKPGKVRLCLDARKVNSVTVKDAYPLPLIDGILSRLPKARFITSLDLKDAFWQIPLDERSKEKTAFTVPGRPLYQFVTMPFGLCNAPQTMSRLMDKVVPAHLRTKVFIYLDDLLLITETFEEHILLLHEVAFCMRKANLNLTINIEKNFSRPFSIQCDASKNGIGAVLAQRNDDNDELPIAFMSHKLTSAQKNYSVSEQECLAAVMAVKKFRAYVEGH